MTKVQTEPDLENWDMVIEPHRHLLDLKLGDLWRYRDLVMLFVRRDFVSLYKQTILGSVMVDADLELIGLESPGEGARIIEKHHGNWHRWDSQVVSMD